jgi:hypothetical protein
VLEKEAFNTLSIVKVQHIIQKYSSSCEYLATTLFLATHAPKLCYSKCAEDVRM